MKKDLVRLVSVLFALIYLAGCGAPATLAPNNQPTPAGNATATLSPSNPLPSDTPDPCAKGQLEAEVQKVHRHMREFDDASLLASNLPRDQLKDSITNLQRIRREAEDEEIPACLADLKKYEVDHMNSVINTLVSFMGGTSQQALEQGISIAREQHDQYTLELARLLGLTVVPATEPAGATPEATTTP
ncbi:MAG: hypothetical protein ACM3PS_13045 [Syntrophothermus sp.]